MTQSRDEINAYMRAWRARNRDHRNAYQREWRRRNHASELASARRWAAKNPDKVADRDHRHRARKVAAHVERVHRSAIFRRDRGVCQICRRPVDPNRFELDHLVPLTRGGPHARWNVGLAHRSCNARKGNRFETYRLAAPAVYRRRPPASFRDLIASRWFRKALRQAESKMAIGFDAMPAVYVEPPGEGAYLIVKIPARGLR